MSNFYAKDGQFWLDGQPQLIQAGEFHYFRSRPEHWPHRLTLLKQAGFNSVAAYIPWLWHQPAEGVSDFDGSSHPMRNLTGFLDLATEMGLWIIARPGPYIMAETINEGIPPWLFATYPQVALISQDQTAQNIASYGHPAFLACVRHWYQAVFSVLAPRQITRGGKIIMVQLDNEMGMPHWVRNSFDTNPHTLAQFAAYLQATGKDSQYPAGDLPTFLRQTLQEPAGPHAAAVVSDYRHFYRHYLANYTTFLWAEAQANGLELLPIVNVHGFMNGGKTFPIGLSQLINVIEMEGMITATDVYPLHIGEGNFHQLLWVNEATKAVQNPAQPLFSVEFQAGGNNDFSNGQSSFYDLHSRLSISVGMRAINHYLFFDGENHPLLSPVKRHDWGHPVRKDGTLRSHFGRYPHLSQVLASYGPALTTAQPQTVTTIAFLLDHFMTEVNNSATQATTQILSHQREVVLCDFIARGLALTHRPFKALELSRGLLDVAETPTCWIMLERQCPAGVQQKLVDYVKNGGRLIAAGRMCLEDFDQQPCTILKEALAIEQITTDAPFAPNQINAFAYQDVPVTFLESYTGQFDQVFATRPNGDCVGFVQTIGQGQLMMLAAALAANTLDDLDILAQMAHTMGCHSPFQLSHWADVRLSRGATGSFLFINNYQDDPITTTISYEGEPMFGGRPIHLPARTGHILPLNWQLTPNILIHYATAEILAVTDSGQTITLQMAQTDFSLALSLTGYHCEGATPDPTTQHWLIHSPDNPTITLKKG